MEYAHSPTDLHDTFWYTRGWELPKYGATRRGIMAECDPWGDPLSVIHRGRVSRSNDHRSQGPAEEEAYI